MKKTVKISNNLLSSVKVKPTPELITLSRKVKEQKKALRKLESSETAKQSQITRAFKKMQATKLEKEIVALEIHVEKKPSNLAYAIIVGHEAHIRRIKGISA